MNNKNIKASQSSFERMRCAVRIAFHQGERSKKRRTSSPQYPPRCRAELLWLRPKNVEDCDHSFVRTWSWKRPLPESLSRSLLWPSIDDRALAWWVRLNHLYTFLPSRSANSPRTTALSLFVLLVIFSSLLLAGCSEIAATPPPAPPSIPPDVLADLLRAYTQRRAIRLDGETEERILNRHHVYFVRRRMLALARLDPSWVAPANSGRLDARIDFEVNAVMAYLQTKLGTRTAPGPLRGGADPATPPHLDLQDVAKVKVRTPASSVRERARRYATLRQHRVRTIVWRACALHDALWQASADGASATLLR